MKKFLKTIYIIDTILLYFILFIYLLWSIFHMMSRFPPKIEAPVILLFVIFSFIALFKIILKKAENYHLLESIVLPTATIMSSLYYIIPIMVKMMPILKEQQRLEGKSAIDFNAILPKIELIISKEDFGSLDHAFMLFHTETLPFVISVIVILLINFLGNFKIYFSSTKYIKPKQTKKGLL